MLSAERLADITRDVKRFLFRVIDQGSDEGVVSRPQLVHVLYDH